MVYKSKTTRFWLSSQKRLQKTMKPRKSKPLPQDDLFKVRLQDIVNPQHPLVEMRDMVDWSTLDQELGHKFCATNGASALPTRLMVGLMYLQHTFNLSDETVVERWWSHLTGSTSVVKRSFNIDCLVIQPAWLNGDNALGKPVVNGY